MSDKIIDTIKKAALEAVENTKPADLAIGTVVSADPLSVQIDQGLTLPAGFLLLTSLTSGFFNLHENERVLMLRVQNGQKYLILDRIKEV